MGIENVRIGFAGAHRSAHNRIFKRASCTDGGFITSPSSGQQVDVNKPVSIVWGSSCMNITAADIYLYAPYMDSPLIQIFQNVDFAQGSYNTSFKPKWWNSTSSVNLQLKMVETQQPIFSATLPPGPIWTALYNSSEASTQSDGLGSVTSGSDVTVVNNLASKGSGGLSRGKIAAAVLVPLIVIGLGLAIYIKLSRAREAKNRKRWSERVDQRMSTISVDWRSMSTKGAEAAIRASMAGPNRSSIWSGTGSAGIGSHRPSSSTFAVEGSPTESEMTQIRRPGVGLRGPIPSAAGSVTRVSRISFAADTRFSKASSGDLPAARGRPSTDSRRTGTASRAFHSAYIPPVPSRLSEFVPEETPSGTDSDEHGSGFVSPTQREGPKDLSVSEIQARLKSVNGDTISRPSLDEMMPALNMMRAMNNSEVSLPLADSPQSTRSPPPVPAPLQLQPLPVPSAPSPPPSAAMKSPVMGAMPMQPMSSDAAMSPDAMLRAYAERRKAGSGIAGLTSPPGTPVISYPMPIAVPGSALPSPGIMPSTGAMRTLYAPPTIQSETSSIRSENNPFRKSMARQSSYDNDEMHYGTAQ